MEKEINVRQCTRAGVLEADVIDFLRVDFHLFLLDPPRECGCVGREVNLLLRLMKEILLTNMAQTFPHLVLN